MSAIITHINPILIRIRYALLAGVLFLGVLALFQLLLNPLAIDLTIDKDLLGTLVPFLTAASISLALFVPKEKNTTKR